MPDPWLVVILAIAVVLAALAAWQPRLRRPIAGVAVAAVSLYAAFLLVVMAALSNMDAGGGLSPLVYVLALVIAAGGLLMAWRVGVRGRRSS